MHGYSSSEESEDPRRPRTVLYQNSAENDQKKRKKKRRLPPQQSINRIWKKFSSRKFHTALAVLPFDPVIPASSDRPNELLREGYERAADECRRKVHKIVGECRRVNMRYRDAGWDLDWDFKYQRGNCLNSLGSDKFELSDDSKAVVPKAVKRVHEIFEEPTFMKHVSGADVKQGQLGDCWIMAGLTAVANVEGGIQRACVAHDTEIGIYGFVFYRDGEWIYSIIDDKLYLKSPCWDFPSSQRNLLQQIDREDVEHVYRKTYQTGSRALFFGQCKDQNETWVPLLEKAYAKAHGDYGSLANGWTGEGLEDLCGGVTTELFSSDILDTDEFWDKEMSRVNQEFLFSCSTGILEPGYGQRDGICEAHAYIVLEARTLQSGQRLVKLRNPWGKVREGLWKGAWSDGSKEWTAEAQAELGHTFGSDSVFWIQYEDLIAKYTHFDRTRLFRDPDWRCCQRWIGADVPWKAEYREKLHISLSTDSPLVLVVSQLDGRYWRGLEGQYTFRLSFRLHHQDKPGAEDYIVRSHGNYFMRRSVSVELPEVAAGKYVVYLKVTGERDTEADSVDQVVKRELSERVQHPKLEQVGYAYDLAHSKAWAYMEMVAALRRKRDQQKASGYRARERRRTWERRRLNREVSRKQARKNADKRQRKRAEGESARRRREEGKERDEAGEKKRAGEARRSPEAAAAGAGEAGAGGSGSPDGERGGGEGGGASEAGSPSPATGTSSEGSVVVLTPPDDGEKQEARAMPKAGGRRWPVERRFRAAAAESDESSSDSPVEEWEELYSSDDLTRKPRRGPQPCPPARDDYDSEEEEAMPAPWNAVCIVGFRVYSKDAGLQLRTVMEGGALLEDGMGEKGEADLDNGQANAAGVRIEAHDGAATATLAVRTR